MINSNSSKISIKLIKFKTLQGQKVYFHRIIVEEPSDSSKHTISAKCRITELSVKKAKLAGFNNHTLLKRSVLPEDFEADA